MPSCKVTRGQVKLIPGKDTITIGMMLVVIQYSSCRMRVMRFKVSLSTVIRQVLADLYSFSSEKLTLLTGQCRSTGHFSHSIPDQGTQPALLSALLLNNFRKYTSQVNINHLHCSMLLRATLACYPECASLIGSDWWSDIKVTSIRAAVNPC